MPEAAAPADSPSADGTPGAGDGIGSLDPDREPEAATILAAATGGGSPTVGAAVLAAARRDPETEVFGRVDRGELVAVYTLRRAGLSMEIPLLAVAPAHRRRGHGRACLTDALARAGKRPLVAETDDGGLPFYRAVGFKLVGKRRDPSGAVRYRLGWHAPRPGLAERSPLQLFAPPRPARETESEGVPPEPSR